MKSFLCRVYRFDYTHEFVSRDDWAWMPVAPAAQLVTSASEAGLAAAEAYVRGCGLARARKLKELDAPAPAIRFERTAARVWNFLRPARCWQGQCFYFDNRVEVFYITVKLVEEMDDFRRKIEAISFSIN